MFTSVEFEPQLNIRYQEIYMYCTDHVKICRFIWLLIYEQTPLSCNSSYSG